MSYVLCVTLNPVLDTTYFVDEMRPAYRTESHRVTHIAGGKGNNAARALELLGVRAHSLTVLGGMIGRDIVEVWKDDPFEATPVWVSGETRLQITVIDKSGTQRAFYAPPSPFSNEDAEDTAVAFEALVGNASAVCLCGSSPSPAADYLYRLFLERGRKQGALTLLDTYGYALREGLAAKPDVVKVNIAEASGFLGRMIEGQPAEQRAVQDLRDAGAEIAVLTLGDRGALLAAGEGTWYASPPPVQAINPIGSGDAMTAGIVAGLIRGGSPLDAFRLGMAAAAANTLTWDACRFDLKAARGLRETVEIEKVVGVGFE
jgi:tagatose 6-phosphate kinase